MKKEEVMVGTEEKVQTSQSQSNHSLVLLLCNYDVYVCFGTYTLDINRIKMIANLNFVLVYSVALGTM